MASLKELLELTIQGKIGQLLIEALGGELGHTYARKDSDFLIIYPEGTEPPELEAIFHAIQKWYAAMGYTLISKEDNGRDLLEFHIIPDGGEECLCLIVVITTRYPHDGHHRCVRVTVTDTF